MLASPGVKHLVSPHRSGDYQKVQEGLEDMKQQYLSTVEKIRGRSGHLALALAKRTARRCSGLLCVWQET